MRINHLAVLVAAVSYYAWSAVWFIILGRQWQAYTGQGAAAPSTYIISFVLAIIFAYVVGMALADSDNPNMVRHGIEFGVFMGAGVWAVNLLSLTLYEGRPMGLWLIDAFHVIIGMAIMGAIVGGWRKRAA